MDEHVKVDDRHKIWIMLNGRLAKALFTTLGFLLGAVATGEHLRTNISDRIESIEKKIVEFENDRKQDHLDNLNFQREMLNQLHAHELSDEKIHRRRQPDIIRYYPYPRDDKKDK
jgi:hypothetical protein